MNIIKGTFLLSLMATAAVGFFGARDAMRRAEKASAVTHEIWTAQRCGEKFLDQDLTAQSNQYGKFDLGKVGCSQRQYWVNKNDIRRALKTEDPGPDYYAKVLQVSSVAAAGTAVAAFVIINLLGFGYLGARKVYRWVRQGYERAR